MGSQNDGTLHLELGRFFAHYDDYLIMDRLFRSAIKKIARVRRELIMYLSM
mgnify:CR=1 FL=1